MIQDGAKRTNTAAEVRLLTEQVKALVEENEALQRGAYEQARATQELVTNFAQLTTLIVATYEMLVANQTKTPIILCTHTGKDEWQ